MYSLVPLIVGGHGPDLAGQSNSEILDAVTGRIVRVGTSGRTAWLRPPDGDPADAQRPTINLNDRIVVHRSGRLVAVGNVIALSADDVGIRITWQADPILPRDVGLILDSSFAQRCRDRFPAQAGIHATVAQLGPGSVNGWLAGGASDGFRVDDLLLITRESLPIAQAKITALDPHRAAVELTPLTANVTARTGDRASLWPSPWDARVGLVHTTVLSVTRKRPEPILTLAGGTTVGFAPGQAFEFHRAGRFVGIGQTVRVDNRLCQVRFAETLSRQLPQTGDTAIRRAANTFGHHTTPGRIFRIEGDYCLVNVGEREGVERGRELLALRDGTIIARLAVRTVKVDYSGADVTEVLAPGQTIALWDEIHPSPLAETRAEHVATLRRVADGNWAAGCTHGEDRLPGRLGLVLQVRQARETATQPGADGTQRTGTGVVIAEGEAGIVLYSPRSWQESPMQPGMNAILQK